MNQFRAYRVAASARLADGELDVVQGPADDPRRRGAELLAAALAAGFAAELSAAADGLALGPTTVEVEVAGHLTSRRDGRLALVGVEVDALLGAAVADADLAHLAGEIARDRCVVASALDVPFSHRVQVAAQVPA